MPDEQARALKCEQLAARFERSAQKDDTTATEWRQRASQERREAEEHPEAAELRARADEMTSVVSFWEESAAWSRKMASNFQRRAEGHWMRYRAKL
jgi:hypothetical protein